MSSSTHSRRTPTPALRQLLTFATVAFLIFQQLVLTSIPSAQAAGSISLSALGIAYTQNFNNTDANNILASSGSSSSVPVGWAFSETGSNADATYAASDGNPTNSFPGNTYSFGVSGSLERSFGGVRSGTLVPTVGASFTNNTGGTITDLNISYAGEQWRLGTAGRNDRLDFQYSTTATSISSGTYTDVNSLDFTGPVSTGTLGALNGNNNRVNVSGTISGLTIPNGATFFIRWLDVDVTGADDALAIDDFSITPTGFIPPTPTNPSGTGSANPTNVLQGSTTLLTVNVTPGTIPTSLSYVVTGDLSAIGGSPTQPFSDNGNNSFIFNATVQANIAPGAKSLPISIKDDQGRPGSTSIALNVQAPSGSHIVISQVYGGGGNSGSTYKNDFIELYNPTATPVTLNGWSVQYASSGGTTWQITDLSGTLAPGQYYLIQEAAQGGGTTNLPTPNATGNIPMSATTGKVALVDNTDSLGSGCLDDPDIIDFIGYGTSANCFEGAKTANLSNTTAALRNGNGNVDTDNNSADFTIGAPTPRSSPGGGGGGGETAPFVSSTTPGKFGTNVLIDANITINFSEPVVVTGNWFSITCPSGTHAATVSGGPTSYKLDPSVNFANSEQCTVNISANLISDADTTDPPDHLLTDYSWTFTTVSSSGVIRNPDEHLVMGVPSNATTDVTNENDYLMKKPEYALSYNRSRAIPNWTSWHLDSSWRGSQTRTNLFRADPDLPAGWYQVNETSFSGSGFDRGHMTPSADRTYTFEENAATFLMTNMIPQAPDNNQVTWEGLESYARTLVDSGSEVYIISGGYGQGGIGRNGPATTVDQGRVVVPEKTWKVLLVLPAADGDDVTRVNTSTRTIGVIMPNAQGINADWHNFVVSVDEVEALTGFNFFSNVPEEIQAVIEANADGNTRPVANNQSVATPEDTPRAITLTATDAESNPLTYNVTGGPSHGTVSAVGNNVTYTPAPNYYGPDSFTFTASDKYLSSEAATVNINVTGVNDAPSAVNDDKSTPEDTTLSFPAGELTANDSAGANESDQTLTVTGVIPTSIHGTLTLNSGQVTYTPDHNYNGPASFDYQVCDNGTTNGTLDSQCATGTVNITVSSVNDDPVATNDSATTNEDTPVTIDVVANDTDEDGGTPALDSVSGATNGSVSIVDGKAVFAPDADYHGTGGFSYVVSDGQGGTATGSVTVTINSVNDAPVANADSATTDEDTTVVVDVRVNDTDVDGDGLSITNTTNGAHGTVAVVNGSAVYTPAENYYGPDSFTYTLSDGHDGSATGTVNVTVNPVNDAPVLVGVPANATINELAAYTFTATASDVDLPAQTLTFSLAGAPDGAVIDPSTGLFTWTPTEAQGGTGTSYHFTVRVSDGVAVTETDVTINVNEVNQAPTLNPVGNKTVILGDTLSFTATGADQDLPTQTLSYSLVGAVPAGATINSSTGQFSWTPTVQQVGAIYTFKVRVTDSGNLYAEEQISVGVGYSWSGLLPPVQEGGVYKLGRTLPIKFTLTGASAGLNNAVARLMLAKVSDGVVGNEIEADSTSAATSGNLFRSDGDGRYIFNLSTNGLTPGTYQLRVDMGDGVLRLVNISFRD